MIEVDYSKNSSPVTPGEKITYYSFLVVLVALFSGEVILNYEPLKLSMIFFIIAWGPLLVIHELGHAIAAYLVGWKVQEFVIGYGKILKEFHYKGTKVEFRMIPLGGYVLPSWTDSSWSRSKSAFVYFAGPGIELVVFAILLFSIGTDRFTEANESYLIIMMQGIGLSAITGAVVNLIPQEAITSTGRAPNDGFGIILSLFGKRKQ